MMRLRILVAFTTLLTWVRAQDYWEQKDTINGQPRTGVTSFTLGNRGYVVGGLIHNESSKKMYSYSPNQNDWDSEIPLGGSIGGGLERSFACGFSLYNKGYVCLGQGLGTAFMKDLWAYDKTSDTWTQKADFIGTARKGAACFVLSSPMTWQGGLIYEPYAYVGTGQDANGLCDDFFRYSPSSNTWETINSFPGGARRHAVAFELAGFGWLGTGDAGVMKNDFWSYNPNTDTWNEKSSLPGEPRAGATSWSTYPSAYIALGTNAQGSYKKDVWQYNYFQNSWDAKNDFAGIERTNAFSFVINGVPYVGGGYNENGLEDFYAYTGLAAIKENEGHHIRVYPNPSKDYVFIDGVSEGDVLKLINSNGQVLQTFRGSVPSTTIDLQGIPRGLYAITINDQLTQKICLN